MPIAQQRPVLAAAAMVLAAALLLAGAGCTGSSDGVSLDGTSWTLIRWSGSSQDPAGFTITAEFASGRIGGTSAVNSYGGPYTAGGDGSFSLGELVSTTMAGSEPAMRAEQHYLTLLAAIRSYRLEGGRLVLSDAAGKEALVYTATGPSPGD